MVAAGDVLAVYASCQVDIVRPAPSGDGERQSSSGRDATLDSHLIFFLLFAQKAGEFLYGERRGSQGDGVLPHPNVLRSAPPVAGGLGRFRPRRTPPGDFLDRGWLRTSRC
jgi:hypothetical protein